MRYIESVRTTIKNRTSTRVFYVSNEKGNDSNDGSFASPFKTVQAGVNAAAAVPATWNTPAFVRVYPSTGSNVYTENVTISQQGIFLESFPEATKPDGVRIKGTVTVNLSGTAGGVNFTASTNFCYIRGFTIQGLSGGAGISFTGTSFQRLFLNNCYLDSSGGSGLVADNTGISGSTPSTVTARDTDINNNSASNPSLQLTAGRIFIAGNNPSIHNDTTSGPSIIVSGANTTLTINNASIDNTIQVTHNTANVTISNTAITTGANVLISTPSTPSTGVITLGNNALSSSAATIITGSGVIALAGQNVLTSSGAAIATTVSKVTLSSLMQGPLWTTSLLSGTTAAAATNAGIVMKDGHFKSAFTTAPTTTLQAGAGSTATVTLSNATDTAGSITLTPNGSAIATGAQVIVNFNKAYNVAPIVMFTPKNASAAQLTAFYVSSSTTGFTLNFANAATSGTAYQFFYFILETQ